MFDDCLHCLPFSSRVASRIFAAPLREEQVSTSMVSLLACLYRVNPEPRKTESPMKYMFGPEHPEHFRGDLPYQLYRLQDMLRPGKTRTPGSLHSQWGLRVMCLTVESSRTKSSVAEDLAAAGVLIDGEVDPMQYRPLAGPLTWSANHH